MESMTNSSDSKSINYCELFNLEKSVSLQVCANVCMCKLACVFLYSRFDVVASGIKALLIRIFITCDLHFNLSLKNLQEV